MKPSPLHLKHYFFTRIHLDACEDPTCVENEGMGALKTQIQCQPHNEDPLRWMVTLGVKLEDESEGQCSPYTADFEAVGLFTVDEGFPEERRTALVQANAPAVLFGAIREMLTNLTSRGPYNPINLKTVTFVDDIQSGKNTDKEEE